MSGWGDHLAIAPVLLPLLASAVMLLFDERRRTLKAVLSLATTAALVVLALLLLRAAGAPAGPGAPAAWVYRLGDWPAPFGIVLVVDRLSALMLLLSSLLGFAALLYALARWSQAGPRFHSLFLLQLMGLNGAFLTGDLFNLFVFFEVLLAASYGLALHGSGRPRVKAGLHYVAVNLSASTLFLVGASLLYGVTGTLNMADLALRIPTVPAAELGLLHAGAGLLGVAFLIKAGMWPLSFWLPATYAVASAPVAALFAVMTKVGVYVILRLWLLLFGTGAGASAGFGAGWLLIGGMATVVFGLVGVLASRSVPRLTSFCVLVSSGTLLAAIGTGDARVLSGALYYLVSSTLGLSALFLLAELLDRGRGARATEAGGAVFSDEFRGSLEDEFEAHEVGLVLPATTSLLAGAFAMCALVLAGLPPLSGFVAKFALMTGVLRMGESVAPSAWVLVSLIIASGFATLLAMMRVGIDVFWTPIDRQPPRVRLVEAVPIVLLLAASVALTIGGGGAMRYAEATTAWLGDPAGYTGAVLTARPDDPAPTPAERP